MNNFYQNPYQPTMITNPYIQNPYNQNVYNQLQQSVGINGRFVENFDGITSNDVGMNGQPSIFPKNDLSEIEVRRWNADGTISKMSFYPISLNDDNGSLKSDTNTLSDKPIKSLENAFKCVTSPLEERLKRIEDVLNLMTTKKGIKNES